MVSSQSTTDLDAQIAKLEEKLNNLLDKVQQAQAISDSPISSSSTDSTIHTQENNSTTPQKTSRAKSRQEILAEYEKDYLARLQQDERAQEEIRRKASESESQKITQHASSTRGSLPKGF